MAKSDGELVDVPTQKTIVGYKWKPIEDISADPERDRELEALCDVWTRQKENLSQEKAIAKFNKELAREWAVETGIVEGVYTLDKGTTQTLIEHGIDARYIPHEATNRPADIVAAIIQAHQDVLEGLFAFIKTERPLSTSYIKELHGALLKHHEIAIARDQFGQLLEVPLLKGAYKMLPNNPTCEDGTIHEYCPPEHVAAEMDRMIDIHLEHVTRGLHPVIKAAWLHHAFTQIHPFQDGNGRVARSIATLVLLKAGLFPLIVNRDDRLQYIATLEAADEGNLNPLFQFFSSRQKRLLTRAIGLAFDVQQATTVEEAILNTTDMLVKLGRIIPQQWLMAQRYAERLRAVVQQKLNNMANFLHTQLTAVNSGFVFQAGTPPPPPIDALMIVSRKLKYDPDFNQFHQYIELTLRGPTTTGKIVISFHGIGVSYRGILAVSAFFQDGDKEPVPLSEDIFRISYSDDINELEKRFTSWNEASLITGVGMWRRTLL